MSNTEDRAKARILTAAPCKNAKEYKAMREPTCACLACRVKWLRAEEVRGNPTHGLYRCES